MRVALEEWRMSITITDPALLAQLATGNRVEFTDPTGRVLGYFTPEGLGKLPPGVKSPFTDEELAELRQQRNGRPLADILRDLKGRG
jgi:hypothetical protein